MSLSLPLPTHLPWEGLGWYILALSILGLLGLLALGLSMAPVEELSYKLVTGMAADPANLFFCVHQNVGLSVVYRFEYRL